MSRRTSRRRRGTIRLNRKRRRSSRGRRVRRNPFLYGVDVMKGVVVPVLGGTAGFMAARYLGNMLATRDMGTSDPKVGKTIVAAAGIAAIGIGATQVRGDLGKTLRANSGALILGMGLASAEAWLRNTPLLGGSPAAAVILPDILPDMTASAPPPPSSEEAASGVGSYYETAASGLADYYSEGMLGGLGADPGNQGLVEGAMNKMEAVSTVIPTDTAMRASTMPQFASVSEPFANNGDRGHAGGVFARHLFSGMMGS